VITADVPRRLAAEGLGTWLLVTAVIGSGIMGAQLAGGNVAIALLANTLATAAILAVLITTLAPISGAHFNPAVSAAMAATGTLPWGIAAAYTAVQTIGGVAGAFTAHAMFGLSIWQVSLRERSAPGQLISESVATFGLLFAIWGCIRRRPDAVAWVVAAYIGSAYWFTASTSFANPAVTIARTFTDTFAGIRPFDAPSFIAAQAAGAAVGTAVARWLYPAPLTR